LPFWISHRMGHRRIPPFLLLVLLILTIITTASHAQDASAVTHQVPSITPYI
jgi:hypothetical protein